MEFADHDVTDSYRDYSSAFSGDDTETRHPRGDSPLPPFSHHDPPSTSSRVLDQLLSFLDQDTDNEEDGAAAEQDEQEHGDAATKQQAAVATASASSETSNNNNGSSTKVIEDTFAAPSLFPIPSSPSRLPPLPPLQQSEPVPSLESPDSIRRTVGQVLDEFDAIVSRNGGGTGIRAPSRLRNLPASPETLFADEFRDVEEQEEQADRQAHRVEDELRSAKEYIKDLQEELLSIQITVSKLRGVESHPDLRERQQRDAQSDAGSNASLGRSKSRNRASRRPRVPVNPEAEAEKVVELVRHLLSVLPSMSGGLSPPSVDTILYSLAFTRSIDQMAHHRSSRNTLLPPSSKPAARHDADVFDKANLEKVLAKVEGWKKASRQHGTAAGRR